MKKHTQCSHQKAYFVYWGSNLHNTSSVKCKWCAYPFLLRLTVWQTPSAVSTAFSYSVLSAICNYILTRLSNPDCIKWWPLRSDMLSVFSQSVWISPNTHKRTWEHTRTDTRLFSVILPASWVSGFRHIPQLNQSLICNGKDWVTPNGCHSEGLHSLPEGSMSA